MSRFSISQISLRQLLVGAIIVVVIVLTFFWFSSNRHAPVTADEHRQETQRIEKVMQKAYPNLPRPWLNKKQ